MFELTCRLLTCCLLLVSCLALPARAQEDCSGCVDADGDGLVGCYDPDCHVSPGPCDGSYLNQVLPAAPDCDATMELSFLWAYDNWWWQVPVLGDIDGDGEIEVVTRGISEDIRVHDGATGELDWPMAWLVASGPYGPLALGDVDADGSAEIFTGGFNGGTVPALRRIEHDLSETWVTSPEFGLGSESNTRGVSLADFDGDGLPETHQRGAIRDAQSGTLLLDLSTEPLLLSEGCVAADFFPDDACPSCAGLELASTSGVWAVDVRAGLFELVGSLPGYRTGQLAVADWNGDEALDLIVNVTDRHVDGPPSPPWELFAWDPRTSEILGRHEHELEPPSGVPLVSDFDGDAGLEIALLHPNPGLGDAVIRLWDDDFSVMDDLEVFSGSFDGSLTAFDFDRDGISEIITRGDRWLQVLSALDGTILASSPCPTHFTGPRDERPLVADVDGDGQAEILAGCEDGMLVLNVEGAPAARSVVNQFQDFNVQVNDDLTIPCQQQNHADLDLHPSLRGFLSSPGVFESIGTPCSEADLCDPPEPGLVTDASATIICSSGPTTLTVSATTGCVTEPLFRWLDETGAVACDWSSDPHCDVTASEGATYTVELTCRGSCVTSTVEVVVTAIEPTAVAGEDRRVCPGDRVVLDGSASVFPDCAEQVYAWSDSPSGMLSWQSDPRAEVYPDVDTDYYLTTRCVGGPSCRGRDTVSVTITDDPPGPAFGAALRAEGATPATASFEWWSARILLPIEHVHVYRATEAAGPFTLVDPVGDHRRFRGTRWTDEDASGPIYFYDIRFVTCTEVVGESPWRPLP